MHILVLNGSPKGEYSITLQTVRYLEKLSPADTFEVLHVGQKIKSLEKDFAPAAEALDRAELLLFSYPVYTFLAPSQLHRFIELVKQHNVPLAGKFATQLTTSKHFYDVTAHRYIEENCADLSLRYIRGLSADMEDLLTEKGRNEARCFWQRVQWAKACGYAEKCFTQSLPHTPAPVTVPETAAPAEGGDVVIVTDAAPEDHSLCRMIERFRRALPMKSRIINIGEYPLKGGCLGCFRCAADGQCIYTDGFDAFLREQIQSARAIIYAFTIRDHCMGARFKMYDDRQFCNGHRTVTMGTAVGYLVSGSYRSEPNVQMLLEARAQVGSNIPVGVATDEFEPDAEIDRLAASLTFALQNRIREPQNFYGIGGMKIFRDLIYQMRGMMKADHRFYKSHGQYDFPQKRKGTILKMYLVGALLSSPKIRAKMGNQMNEGMIGPYRKVVNAAAEKKE